MQHAITKEKLEITLKAVNMYTIRPYELDYCKHYGYRLTELDGSFHVTIRMTNREMNAYLQGILHALERIAKAKRLRAMTAEK